jgi:hypothetical protein
VLIVAGSWKEIAAISGGTSAAAGLMVHLAISVLMGATYGLLFQREAPNLASGICWGLVYGLIGWVIVDREEYSPTLHHLGRLAIEPGWRRCWRVPPVT